MKTTIGIINYNTPQHVYYLLKSIQKQCKGLYDICVFDTGIDRPILHRIDNVTIYRNNAGKYFETEQLTSNQIYNLAVECMINLVNSDWLILVDAKTLVKSDICSVINEGYTAIAKTDNSFVDSGIVWLNLNKIKDKKIKVYNDTNNILFTDLFNNIEPHEIKHISDKSKYIIEYIGNSVNSWALAEWIYIKNGHLWKTEYYDVIVSLTTFKGRLYDKTTYNVLLALLTQKTKFNYKVTLVLSYEEFGYDFILPPDFEYLKKRYKDKFEILWTEKDTKPLKKLDPTMAKYPDLPIITLDDDDLCDSQIVEYVMHEHVNDPYYVLGTWIEVTPSFVKWVAGVRLFPPHSLYEFPIEEYYTFYDGMLDDNWNAMRCAFKMTPVKGISTEHNKKTNQTDLKLTRDYQKTPWGEYYKRFMLAHLDKIPEELYYE